MFDSLKKFFGGHEEAVDSGAGEVIGRLDIAAAKFAHENWKVRLLAFLEGKSSENFAPEVICFDDRCDLGRWIHGDAQNKLGKYPGFTALMGHHKMFHYAASNVVSLQQAGRKDEARKMLDGVFAQQSHAVVDALDSLALVGQSARRRA